MVTQTSWPLSIAAAAIGVALILYCVTIGRERK